MIDGGRDKFLMKSGMRDILREKLENIQCIMMEQPTLVSESRLFPSSKSTRQLFAAWLVFNAYVEIPQDRHPSQS